MRPCCPDRVADSTSRILKGTNLRGLFTNQDDGAFGRALEVLKKSAGADVQITTDMQSLCALIAFAQLGLRHPNASSLDSALLVEKVLSRLIEQMDPEHGDLWTVLNRGFNPTFDQPL